MRIPTLAVCALATLTLQDWHQSANAQSAEVPVPIAPIQPNIADKPIAKTIVAIASPESLLESSAHSASFGSSPVSASAIAQEPTAERGIEIPVIPAPVPARPSSTTVQPSPQLPVNRSAPPRQADALPPRPVTRPGQTSPLVQDSNRVGQRSLRTAPPTRVSIEQQELPVPGVLPRDFTFPIRLEIILDPAITTNTPITDQEFPTPLPRSSIGTLEELARYREAQTAAMNRWAGQVRGCLLDYPQLVSLKPDGKQFFVLFNGTSGKIVKNANGRLVCPSGA